MSQYGNSPKNIWARSGQNIQAGAVPQALMTNPNMFQYPQAYQGQQAAMGMNMSGLAQTAVAPMQAAMQATTQMYGTVSYPTRALNSAAFQQNQQQQQQQQNRGHSGNKQRVFTGTVTSLQDNFGFVDEDVFFQSSCCVKGSTPEVGDRVLVEALYKANMPFKWNATRIQVLNPDGGPRSGQPYSQSNYNAVPPPKMNSGTPNSSRFSSGGSRFSGGGSSGSGGDRGSRGGGGGGAGVKRDEDRKRRRDERDKDDKAKSPPRKRSRTPMKSSKRPRRPPPRYNVTVPRISLNGNDGDVVEMKKRYSNMYVPSDFFLSEFSWRDTFPLGKPMSLDFPCLFHVFHKAHVDPLVENKAVFEPADSDYIYSAKVMLLASPGLEEFYSKCIVVTEERENSKSTVDEDSLSHPSRLINFLVGTRGKENMAIGGPWSPSEDGDNPSSDPSVLVRTAIRTTKALTGIDLSGCTQWFRFMEVHYHRSETVYRGKSYPARVETVVIFVPDVWSCVPTRLEWDELQLSYQKALDRKINGDDQKEEEEEVAVVEKEPTEEQATPVVKREPKSYTELEPKSMKVSDLQEELEARSLPTKGLKPQLIARLTKSLKVEEEEAKKLLEAEETEKENTPKKDSTEKIEQDDKKKEETGSKKATKGEEEKDAKNKSSTVEDGKENAQKKEATDKKEQDEKKKEDDDKKKVDERERKWLEKRYKLPQQPHIVVHPNKTAKSGKFDCNVQTLSALLGYRQDDTKEHSFEVSLFAELFNEMLMRDFGFNIYRAILEAPEKPKEEKSKDDKIKDKDNKDKEKSKDDKGKDKGKDDDKEQKKDKNKEIKSKDKEKDDNEKELPDIKEKDEEMDDASETEDQNEEEKEVSIKEESSSKDDDSSKDKKSDKESRKERAKLVTFDKMLLLSFTFFDITRCGYIYNKDIEDLLFSLGLTLSRSQIRKLVGKIILGDAVYYRRLTDKPEGQPVPENVPAPQVIGNKLLLPALLAKKSEPKKKRASGDQISEVKKGQMVMVNGTLVDVAKLMEQLTRSEIARVETDRALGKLKDELGKLKDNSSKSEKYIKDLNVDLRDYRERLMSVNSELSTLQSKERQYLRTLNDISDRIKPLIAKPEPPVKQQVVETEVKEVIDLVEEKGDADDAMTIDEDK